MNASIDEINGTNEDFCQGATIFSLSTGESVCRNGYNITFLYPRFIAGS
jgi:hypothetical protein